MRGCLAAALLVAVSGAASAQAGAVDRIVIDKSERSLRAFVGAEQVLAFDVALGRSAGPKRCEGDLRTPEGHYTIVGRNARSAYHRALRLSYPSAVDAADARTQGCAPGGDIMIHGLRNGFGWIGRLHARFDWTRGCIGLANDEIEMLWDLVRDGTPVEIRP